MMQRFVQIMLVLMLAGVGLPAFAQSHEPQDKPADSAWVKQKTQTCAGCHGQNGVSQTGNFPTLAGQYQNYLVHALTAYRDGDRQNGIMAGQVQGLTDAQIKALAQYYSNLESPLYTPGED